MDTRADSAGKAMGFLEGVQRTLASIEVANSKTTPALRSAFHNEYKFFDRSV